VEETSGITTETIAHQQYIHMVLIVSQHSIQSETGAFFGTLTERVNT